MASSEKHPDDPTESSMCELPTRLDQLLLTVPSLPVLYPRLAEFLKSIDGIDAVWLGCPDEERIVQPQLIAGDGLEEYLSGAPIRLLDNPYSPLARAFSTGVVQVTADLSDAEGANLLPFWRERAMRFGWRSNCAIPISETVGRRHVLILYSRQPNFFVNEEIRRFIHHLEAVLGLAMERLRMLDAIDRQRQTTALYKAAVDASPNGIIIANAAAADLPICYVNAAFETITGYSAEEALGRNCRFLQGTDTAQPGLEAVRQALRNAEPCSVELKNYRKDGTMFWNSLRIAPLHDASGALTHFVGVQNDITTLKSSIGENTRANGMYRALMSAAELVVRAQSEREMLDELCRLLVDGGMFAQCWIGRPNIAGDLEIQAIFSSIPVQEQLYANVYTGDEDRIMAVRAWRRSRLQYTNDRLKDAEYAPIQNFYRKHDLHATAILPLYRDGDLWALLTLLSRQSDIFNPELLALLERIARLIGHGLDSLDLREILEEERQHQSWLARHDALTDILNRRGVIERLEEATSRARRHGKMLAVAAMDLDGFKSVNDTHGHSTGDLLLRTIADRLQATLRQTDAVGRLGSDEFVLILEDIDQADDLTLLLSRVQVAIDAPVPLPNDRTAAVRASMGVTLFPSDDSPAERLLRHAERALYSFKESKDDTPQRWFVFHAEEDEQKHARQRTIVSLFRAGNLRVHYQPVIDLQTGRVSGVEALARLAAGDGLLSPAEFLPQLTAADLVALTHEVLAASISDLHRLDAIGFQMSVGINFEPSTLADPKAVKEIRQQIETSGIDPNRIILELLERADTMSLAGSQQALRHLKSCGVRVALDDVGSAYSSLLRVKELPVDMIKLDRTFLIGLERHPRELRFLMNLVHLAQALGLSFVAEGIECAASGDALAALGVRLAQGYSIARPMPFEALLDWLRRYKPRPWTRPTSVLGAVALQLRDLDASARIIEQRPAFLHHLLARNAELDGEIGSDISHASPAGGKLSAAYRTWHSKISALSQLNGSLDFQSFEFARSAYEEEMFQAALDAEEAVQ